MIRMDITKRPPRSPVPDHERTISRAELSMQRTISRLTQQVRDLKQSRDHWMLMAADAERQAKKKAALLDSLHEAETERLKGALILAAAGLHLASEMCPEDTELHRHFKAALQCVDDAVMGR